MEETLECTQNGKEREFYNKREPLLLTLGVKIVVVVVVIAVAVAIVVEHNVKVVNVLFYFTVFIG